MSGIYKSDYPIVYAVLFDYHAQICTFVFFLWLVTTSLKVCSLKGNDLTYFLNSIGYAALWAIVT